MFLQQVLKHRTVPGCISLKRPVFLQDQIDRVKKEDPNLAADMQSLPMKNCVVKILERKCMGCKFWQHDGFPCDCACTALATANDELSQEDRSVKLELVYGTKEFFVRHFHR